jgi:hypothetical protein
LTDFGMEVSEDGPIAICPGPERSSLFLITGVSS